MKDGVFFRKFFISLTAHSAWPLDSWLYADKSSCLIRCLLHQALNGSRDWGPPSVRILTGVPWSMNHSSRISVSVFVSSFGK